MNFFKSILSDEPDPDYSLKNRRDDRDPNGVAPDGSSADAWSFVGLMKTFATRSESLIETYRKDLEEFGSGLKKESDIIREAAARAVKDLPASLEAGTSAAHGVLDGVMKSTAEVISKETGDSAAERPEIDRSSKSGHYSWFEAQLSLIKTDLSTFREDPDNVDEYMKWKLGFRLEEKSDEIESLIGKNGSLEGVYKEVVPSAVDRETFLCRYFYRVDKLKKQDQVRENLGKRVISVKEEEDDELSWDVDDDGWNNGDKNNVVELNMKNSEDASLKKKELNSEEVVAMQSEEMSKIFEESVGKIETSERSDFCLKPKDNEAVKEEEDEDDLEWDEIEDIGSDEEKKVPTSNHGQRPNRVNPREKLIDDEDLSWDIEDDDDGHTMKS